MSNYFVKNDLLIGDNSLVDTIIIKINFDTFEKRSHQTVHDELIAIIIILVVMVETWGNFLLYCLIWYEKYGMDAQKRTITNQLLSSMCVAQMLCNIFIIPIATTILIMGSTESKDSKG